MHRCFYDDEVLVTKSEENALKLKKEIKYF